MESCYEDSVCTVLKNIKEKNFADLKTIQEKILDKINANVATQEKFKSFYTEDKLIFRNLSAEYCFPDSLKKKSVIALRYEVYFLISYLSNFKLY